jgi:ABC-2 type transport system permease protein
MTATAGERGPAGRLGLAGTGSLVRLALRRDRVTLPIWIMILVAMAASSASATVGIYPTVGSRVQAASAFNGTPSLVAMYGRVYDPTSLGALAMLKMSALGAALVAVLAVVTVVRHTRAEEEAGRLELLGATVVGRYAALSAALLVAVGGCLALGLVTALALVGTGLPGAGSLALGLAWAGVGTAFAAVAAVAAQLTRGDRAASGIGAATLGLAYLLRAIGDSADPTGPTWLSWLSPVGWGQQIRPFAGERWWALLLLVAFAAVTAAGGYALAARRDLDAGLLPDRPGPASGAAGLRSPLALAWRLHRGALLGWTAGFVLLGAVLGSIASSVGNLLDSPQARELITKLGGQQGLTDAFLAAELGIVGVIAAAYGVQAALRLRAEETALRAEPVLATAVSRTRWAASHLTLALGGSTVLMAGAGLGAGLAHGAHTGELGRQLGRVLAAALLQLPAVWVVTCIVVAIFGLGPRLVTAGWAALVAFLLVGELGPLLKLSRWVLDLSPFGHLPKVPGGPVTVAPLVWLVVVAALLAVAGLLGLRRRDIG